MSRNVVTDHGEMQALAVVESKPFSSEKLVQLRACTKENTELRSVSQCIQEGWPETIAACEPVTKRYWQIRHDLTVVEGLVLYRHTLVIPKAMRGEILNRIHDGHLGLTKCLNRARGQVFWPGVSADIRQKVDNCEACQTFQRRNHRDVELDHAIPNEPWYKVAVDLFYLAGQNCLLAAD